MATAKKPAPKKVATKAPAKKAAPVKKATPKAPAKKEEVKVKTTKKVSEQERMQMIATAAYFKAEQRGFFGGNPDQDWKDAEREVAQLLSK